MEGSSSSRSGSIAVSKKDWASPERIQRTTQPSASRAESSRGVLMDSPSTISSRGRDMKLQQGGTSRVTGGIPPRHLPDAAVDFSFGPALPRSLGPNPRERRCIHMPLVKVKEDETFEFALRRFKRKCEKSGILSELKKRQHYEKPSAKRKRKMLAARKKTLKRLAQERRMIG